MTREETKLVLTKIMAEQGKMPSESKVDTWASMLGPVPLELGILAAQKFLKETRVFGEPQFSDYRTHVNELYRAAKRKLKPRKVLTAAERSRMSPADVELYDKSQAKQHEISHEQASKIIGVVQQQIPEKIA